MPIFNSLGLDVYDPVKDPTIRTVPESNKTFVVYCGSAYLGIVEYSDSLRLWEAIMPTIHSFVSNPFFITSDDALRCLVYNYKA